MAKQEMDRFRLEFVEVDPKTFEIFLVRTSVIVAPTIIAEMHLKARDTGIAPFVGTTSDYDSVMTAAETAGQRVLSLDEAVTNTTIDTFAPFRSGDARASLSDAAYTYISTKIARNYDQGSVEVENDHYIVFGDGLAVNPSANRSGPKGSKQRQRPKSNKKLQHSWF